MNLMNLLHNITNNPCNNRSFFFLCISLETFVHFKFSRHSGTPVVIILFSAGHALSASYTENTDSLTPKGRGEDSEAEGLQTRERKGR